MDFNLRQALPSELSLAFDILKAAAESLAKRNINQWQYWKNPPIEKVNWVKEGFLKQEFFFIENEQAGILGMVRILEEDILYWGQKEDNAKYIHSLVVLDKFAGHKIGHRVIESIKKDADHHHYDYLRLDCDSTNKRLCSYYEKQGFQLVKEINLELSTYNLYELKLSK